MFNVACPYIIRVLFTLMHSRGVTEASHLTKICLWRSMQFKYGNVVGVFRGGLLDSHPDSTGAPVKLAHTYTRIALLL